MKRKSTQREEKLKLCKRKKQQRNNKDKKEKRIEKRLKTV